MGARRILIADDEPSIRVLGRHALNDAGYEVVEAVDGADAIERLRGDHVDAVLLDVNMPRVDGWGVLEFVRTLSAPPPVVLVTGLVDAEPPGHLNEYVAGIVTKPFAIRQLLKTLELALSKPCVVPASGGRQAARRTFVVETTLLSETGQPLAVGELQEVSGAGFRVNLSLRLGEGDPIRLAFRVPGRAAPVELRGRVRWHRDGTVGAELDTLSESDTRLLRELLGEPRGQA